MARHRRSCGFFPTTLALALAAAILTAGCLPASVPLPGAGPPEEPPADEPAPPAAVLAQLVVYRSRVSTDGSDDRIVAVPVRVLIPEDTIQARVAAAIAAMWVELTPEEREQGLGSAAQALPEARLLGVAWNRPFVIVNFSADLDRMPGVLGTAMFLHELTYTLASIPGVKGVILHVEGEQVGTAERPFTGDGFLFGERGTLHPAAHPASSPGGKAWEAYVRSLEPVDILDLIIATVPHAWEVWPLLGPGAQADYGEATRIDWTAFAGGLAAWRDYTVVETVVEGDTARVTLQGDQVLDGSLVYGAVYRAQLVRHDGYWRWETAD